MKYRDLVQFEPIRTVIQLQQAEQLDKARELVRTFVISEQIGEAMTGLVFPKLQYTVPEDNMGMFVVGNYGTGKSHLMAIISSIAEREDLVDELTSEAVKEATDQIAGKFIVCRAELAGTTFDLSEWLFQTLGQFLEQQGVQFTFPEPDKTLNLKQVLTEMMGAFESKHPNKGFLLVIDELLDYLRELDDQRKIRCFNVLRVLGEFCAESRFRVIAGVQESLFDSPSFSFAAESLRRVKDRFEQLYIQKEDIAYVVKQRLLKKTEKQQSWIRSHLGKFVSLYSRMNEQLDEFVFQFPVHPRYIEVFGQIRIAEKREVLRTLSDTEERAATLSNDDKDRAYFTVLGDLMECSDRTYRPSFRIWEHELVWEERNVGRPGYLFFGAPNERSTTHPVREFYLHFLAPFNPVDFTDEFLSNEVFFILQPNDSTQTLMAQNEGLSEAEEETFEAFTKLLKVYEASRYLADRAQGGLKATYGNKGMEARQKAARWLHENIGKVFSVRYKGKETPLANLITGRRGGDDSFRWIVNHIAASLLEPYFQERLPRYPSFGMRITCENRITNAQEALIWMTGGLQTKQGATVLEALGLLNEERNAISVRQSSYAQAILSRLQIGQVLNRSDILMGEADAEHDENGLEPEWIALVLLALVYTGDIVITPQTGPKVDASNLESSMSIAKIANFKHIQKPTGFPESQLSRLFEILKLPPGLVKNPDTRDDAVKQLQTHVAQQVPELVEMEATIRCFSDAVASKVGKGRDLVITLSLKHNSEERNDI